MLYKVLYILFSWIKIGIMKKHVEHYYLKGREGDIRSSTSLFSQIELGITNAELYYKEQPVGLRSSTFLFPLIEMGITKSYTKLYFFKERVGFISSFYHVADQ